DDELVVNVTAQRFFWEFEYPTDGAEDDIELTSQHILVLPEGRNIRMEMTSVDVIHAFWIPNFRVKMDVMPGRTSELRFTPNQVTGLPDEPEFELVTLDDLDIPGPDDACPEEEEISEEAAAAPSEEQPISVADEELQTDDEGDEPPVSY